MLRGQPSVQVLEIDLLTGGLRMAHPAFNLITDILGL